MGGTKSPVKGDDDDYGEEKWIIGLGQKGG